MGKENSKKENVASTKVLLHNICILYYTDVFLFFDLRTKNLSFM